MPFWKRPDRRRGGGDGLVVRAVLPPGGLRGRLLCRDLLQAGADSLCEDGGAGQGAAGATFGPACAARACCCVRRRRRLDRAICCLQTDESPRRGPPGAGAPSYFTSPRTAALIRWAEKGSSMTEIVPTVTENARLNSMTVATMARGFPA